jgi:hypothetical protein
MATFVLISSNCGTKGLNPATRCYASCASVHPSIFIAYLISILINSTTGHSKTSISQQHYKDATSSCRLYFVRPISNLQSTDKSAVFYLVPFLSSLKW